MSNNSFEKYKYMPDFSSRVYRWAEVIPLHFVPFLNESETKTVILSQPSRRYTEDVAMIPELLTLGESHFLICFKPFPCNVAQSKSELLNEVLQTPHAYMQVLDNRCRADLLGALRRIGFYTYHSMGVITIFCAGLRMALTKCSSIKFI